VTLIQDAVFLYPKRFADGTTETLPLGDENVWFYLMKMTINGNELVFTNQKPYVIWLRCCSRRKKAILMLDPMSISTQTGLM
jgi:hypothetical protein